MSNLSKGFFFVSFTMFAMATLLLSCVSYHSPQQEKNKNGKAKHVEVKMNGKVIKTEKEWKELLTDEQFHIARKKGTERAFTGKYYNHKEKGIYNCVCCDAPLFSSEHKFDSGSGWPSYWTPIASEALTLMDDNSLFMTRTEVMCSRCDAHLGHVFSDGPPPTHKRYCINSAALDFVPKKGKQPDEKE